MDAGGGEDGGPMTYAQAEQFFASMEGPTAQERIDYIFPLLLCLLPRPFVPAPEVAGDDSDDERFSLTSSDSEASGVAGADPAASQFHPAAVGDDGEDHIFALFCFFIVYLFVKVLQKIDLSSVGKSMIP